MTERSDVKKPKTPAKKKTPIKKAVDPSIVKAKTARKPRKKKEKFPELCMTKTCTPEDRKFEGLCRKCYLGNWQALKAQKQQRAQRRLNAYVERISQKYPKDYMERIRDGLENEETFNQMVNELELEDEAQAETEREYLERLSRKVGGQGE